MYVEVEEVTSEGPIPLGFTLAVIPAGRTVYLASQLGIPSRIRRVRTSVDVGRNVPKRYRLPPVTNVRINRAVGKLRASVMNPYKSPLSIYSTANAVLFDSRGRVIGGAAICSLEVAGLPNAKRITPGGRAEVSCWIPGPVLDERLASAGVTVVPP